MDKKLILKQVDNVVYVDFRSKEIALSDSELLRLEARHHELGISLELCGTENMKLYNALEKELEILTIKLSRNKKTSNEVPF